MKTGVATVWIFCTVVALSSHALFADAWRTVTGEAVDTLLSGRSVVYEGDTRASQVFHEDGTTTYIQGRPSSGNWKASDTGYCSQWPPSSVWVCYELFVDESGERIRFTESTGTEWVARFES